MDSSELDVLDKRVAELLGWKHTVGVFVSSWKEAELFQIEAIEADGIVSGGECFFLTDKFSPTRDARQVEVLLGEMPYGWVAHSGNDWWSSEDRSTCSPFRGDDWKHAVVRAWIAWKESQK